MIQEAEARLLPERERFKRPELGYSRSGSSSQAADAARYAAPLRADLRADYCEVDRMQVEE